jgi:uncharacterized damage-inducible protein DinB
VSTFTPDGGTKQIAYPDLEAELANTRKVLERVPVEHLGWKPHEKSFSLGSLATHVARLCYWGTITSQGDEFDLAATPIPAKAATSREELLGLFDETSAAFRRALAAVPDEALAREWTLRMGDHVIFKLPKGVVLRSSVISHIIHHRAQLTVYLRMLDVPVPGLYGPSADEQ